jgi:hypothetical protein
MRHHRRALRKILGEKFKNDEDKEEIMSQLLFGGGYLKQFEEVAAQHFKRKWMVEYKEKIEKEVYTVVRCAQMQEHSMLSGRGWDKLNNTERRNWGEKEKEYSPVLISTGVEGDEGVGLPRRKCTKTIKKAREEFAASINIHRINADGSAIIMYSVHAAITRACNIAGYAWCFRRVVEILISGDAHGTMKKTKMCHLCLKAMGATEDDNSPSSLWGLVHWQGGDDWDSLHTHCESVFKAMALMVQNGCKIDVKFDCGKTLKVKLDFLVTGDGAFLDALIGGGGFAGAKDRKNCPICTCNASDYGDLNHEEWGLKTESYVNHGAHVPVQVGAGRFKFKCPHCSFKCNSQKQSTAERERLSKLSKTQVSAYVRNHHGKQPLRHSLLFMLKDGSVLPDSMHFIMNAVGHHWSHAIAPYVDSTPLAEWLCGFLHHKCGVVINLDKVTTSNHIDAAKLPTLPGGPALKVARYFDLFVQATHHWDGRNMQSEATKQKVRNASAAMSALIALWNEMKEVMEVNERGLPSTQERLDKADMIEELTYAWREAYCTAFTEDAAKPYTHMALHFAQMQRRVQFDIVRYSCQSQEHYGKIVQYLVNNRTSKQLGIQNRRYKRRKGGKKGELELVDGGQCKGYVQEAMEIHAWRQYLKRQLPVKGTDYNRKLHNKINTEPKVLVKYEEWADHHSALSESPCKK